MEYYEEKPTDLLKTMIVLCVFFISIFIVYNRINTKEIRSEYEDRVSDNVKEIQRLQKENKKLKNDISELEYRLYTLEEEIPK